MSAFLVELPLRVRVTDPIDDVTARRRQAIEEIARGMANRQRAALADALVSCAEAAGEPVAVGASATRLGW